MQLVDDPSLLPAWLPRSGAAIEADHVPLDQDPEVVRLPLLEPREPIRPGRTHSRQHGARAACATCSMRLPRSPSTRPASLRRHSFTSSSHGGRTSGFSSPGAIMRSSGPPVERVGLVGPGFSIRIRPRKSWSWNMDGHSVGNEWYVARCAVHEPTTDEADR